MSNANFNDVVMVSTKELAKSRADFRKILEKEKSKTQKKIDRFTHKIELLGIKMQHLNTTLEVINID